MRFAWGCVSESLDACLLLSCLAYSLLLLFVAFPGRTWAKLLEVTHA